MDNKKKSPNKNVVLVSFPPEMLEAIEEIARQRMFNRQDVIREAVSLYISRKLYGLRWVRDGE